MSWEHMLFCDALVDRQKHHVEGDEETPVLVRVVVAVGTAPPNFGRCVWIHTRSDKPHRTRLGHAGSISYGRAFNDRDVHCMQGAGVGAFGEPRDYWQSELGDRPPVLRVQTLRAPARATA